jgi:uncharacterized membrane protein
MPARRSHLSVAVTSMLLVVVALLCWVPVGLSAGWLIFLIFILILIVYHHSDLDWCDSDKFLWSE